MTVGGEYFYEVLIRLIRLVASIKILICGCSHTQSENPKLFSHRNGVF
jgi:hypothetical protein